MNVNPKKNLRRNKNASINLQLVPQMDKKDQFSLHFPFDVYAQLNFLQWYQNFLSACLLAIVKCY